MDDIQLYNSLHKRVEPFTPKEPGKVSMYHCGPTVYKRQHIGNMRRFLFADFLHRSLVFFGYEVREIVNITDVGHLTEDDRDSGEDKMEKEARKEKTTPQDIAKRQTKLFHEDSRALNIMPAHAYPKASAHIAEMQEIITILLEKNHAYKTATGIYFDVQSFPDYGKLSGNTLEAIAAGHRVEVRHEKKHPADFALWIFDTKQLQTWDSPWGTGYPGWHIECSAMAAKYLGLPIDIHTGGEDNRFPHHENEIAQTEAATEQPLARFWMHNRHLQMGGKKMAKREGESITIDTLQEEGFSPLAFRLFVFGSHYRKKIDFSWDSLRTSQENIASIKHTLRRLREAGAGKQADTDEAVIADFKQALALDLNTPEALGVFMKYLKEINSSLEAGLSSTNASRHFSTLLALDAVMGIIEPLIAELGHEEVPEGIQALVRQREEAKQDKKFDVADELRGTIEEKGYTIEDTPSGPRVIRK